MMKSGKTVLVVDSVEDAVKFYSDKLAFDIVNLRTTEGNRSLSFAELRKGKCYIIFRIPVVDELVEFSQVKYCMSRGAGMYADMKKGLEKYFERCRKKGVQVLQELKEQPWGEKNFVVKDPYGFKLTFAQSIEGFVPSEPNKFCGMTADSGKSGVVEEMVQHLRNFGLSRRSAKKYAKAWLKKSK
ncbi:VOC family protein [Candidatus Babeliales bacterium]|nr:VOC family protein [Candidatus Babeliales bacterium]